MEIVQELLKVGLFENFSTQDMEDFLKNCDYRTKDFKRNEEILGINRNVTETAIILDGIVDVIQISPNGKEELVIRDTAGDMFGQAFNLTSQINNLTHNIAATDCRILFLDINKVIDHPSTATYYSMFVHNITRILAQKNINLTLKIELLTQKSLRDKLMTFFKQCALKTQSSTFFVDFNREQLAHYICSERSSVSRELGYMQDDGLITISGKRFTLL